MQEIDKIIEFLIKEYKKNYTGRENVPHGFVYVFAFSSYQRTINVWVRKDTIEIDVSVNLNDTKFVKVFETKIKCQNYKELTMIQKAHIQSIFKANRYYG